MPVQIFRAKIAVSYTHLDVYKRQVWCRVRSELMEKVYKTMHGAGACSIALGIVILVTGVIVGVVSIVSGSLLLKRKSDITF